MASLYSHKLQECMHPNLSQLVLDSSQPLPKFNEKEIVPSAVFKTPAIKPAKDSLHYRK